MVEAELVTDDIASGEEAVKALDEERADVRSAFWFYDRDAAEYRLILAMPAVDREGPASGYKLVQRAFLKHRVPLYRCAASSSSESANRLPEAYIAPWERSGTPAPRLCAHGWGDE